MQNLVHLLSGGLDSVVMLHQLHRAGFSIHALLIDYGQRHIKELDFARHHTAMLGIKTTRVVISQLRGSFLTGDGTSPIVPFRNAALLSLAVNLAVSTEIKRVTIGCNQADAEMFPDCRQEFLDAFNASIKAAGYDVTVIAPYIDKTKSWIAELALTFGVKPDATWSCYTGRETPCGTCVACLKRKEAHA